MEETQYQEAIKSESNEDEIKIPSNQKHSEDHKTCNICGKSMLTSNFKKHFKKVHEKVLCIFCTPGYTIHRNTYDKENPVLVRHYSKLLVEHMETDHNASHNLTFMLFASTSSEIKLIKHGFRYYYRNL